MLRKGSLMREKSKCAVNVRRYYWWGLDWSVKYPLDLTDKVESGKENHEEMVSSSGTVYGSWLHHWAININSSMITP